MDKYTANRYIWLKQQIAAGGGSVPQELIDEVNALDATVNGDETQDPPVVGLVDIVGDLENAVEDLDVTVNGDSTTIPETLGLVDRVEDLENASTILSGTLTAGQTTLTITDDAVTGNALYDVYLPLDKSDLGFTSISVSGTTLTIVFPEAQLADIAVKVKVTGVT